MFYFNTDPVTREFISVEEAREDPLDKGRYLIPARGFTDPPPAFKLGFAIRRSRCWQGWEYVEDHRNKQFYYESSRLPFDMNTNEFQWHGLGEIPEGLVEELPEIETSRDEVSQERSWLYSTTSDPLLMEALRMKYMDEDGWDDKMQEAFAAYHSIREENPFPEE